MLHQPVLELTWAQVTAPGLVNFVPALAYHSCLNQPAAFTQLRPIPVVGKLARDPIGDQKRSSWDHVHAWNDRLSRRRLLLVGWHLAGN